MTNQKIKALGVVSAMTLGICVIVSLIMSVFLYFEMIGLSTVSKVLYGTFVIVLLVFSFVCARIVGAKGLFVGLSIGLGLVLLSLLYRLIGVESGIGITFMIRNAVILLVAASGAVVGVNTVKQ